MSGVTVAGALAGARPVRRVRVPTGMEICYETSGDPSGRPLLLIMGFACPMTWWLPEFYEQFVERGFYVIRFDNRDCGKSTRFGGSQGLLSLLPFRAAPYTVDDMAEDAGGLLEALKVPAAHVMGISLGGMIAQSLAINHPRRVLSLSTLASSPSFSLVHPWRAPRLGVLFRMVLSGRKSRDVETHVKRSLPLWRKLNRSHFPFEERRVRDHLRDAWDWSGGADPAADRRQLRAVLAAPDRTEGLRHLRQPAFVLHGSDDPLVRVRGGLATWKAIRRGRFVIVTGMGHYTPESTWKKIVKEVDRVATIAERDALGG